MEFHVTLASGPPDLEAIETAMLDADPAAVLDIDGSGQILRVSTSIDLAQLAAVISASGYPVSAQQLRQLPSICCGSCSG